LLADADPALFIFAPALSIFWSAPAISLSTSAISALKSARFLAEVEDGNGVGAFFSVRGAGNKNFVSGADTALGIDGLTKGEVAFMDLVDSDGKPTGVMPSIMLVPTALSAMGTQLYESVELRPPARPRTPSSPSPTRIRARGGSASRSAAISPTPSTPATRLRRGTSSLTPAICPSSRWHS